eukprot:COSAG02_NODE_401_length_23083_cov_26.955839_2_plen_88_part_00
MSQFCSRPGVGGAVRRGIPAEPQRRRLVIDGHARALRPVFLLIGKRKVALAIPLAFFPLTLARLRESLRPQDGPANDGPLAILSKDD